MKVQVAAKAVMMFALAVLEVRQASHGFIATAAGFLCLLPLIALAQSATTWKALFVLFALLALVFVFALFGGLEPNSPGNLQSEGWFSLDGLLFASLVAAAGGAVAAGTVQERSQRAPAKGGA